MLNISTEKNNKEAVISLEGRLDTTSSPELEKALPDILNGTENLVFDLAKLDYISSAGLRVLLSVHKTMKKQGDMVIRNSSDDVKEVFEVTGFSDILNIE